MDPSTSSTSMTSLPREGMFHFYDPSQQQRVSYFFFLCCRSLCRRLSFAEAEEWIKLDAYQKINEEFYNRTLSDGVITLISSIVMLLLFFSEFKLLVGGRKFFGQHCDPVARKFSVVEFPSGIFLVGSCLIRHK
nr:endoplasmic reticulum-Golgi intermediate compartment protein 3-like [Ipomoea batatas]